MINDDTFNETERMELALKLSFCHVLRHIPNPQNVGWSTATEANLKEGSINECMHEWTREGREYRHMEILVDCFVYEQFCLYYWTNGTQKKTASVDSGTKQKELVTTVDRPRC